MPREENGLFSVLKTIGAGVASMFPGGPLVMAAVNAILPDGDRLSDSATGTEIMAKMESLPPDTQAQIHSQYTALQIAKEKGWTSRYEMMTAADGQSTRPRIALMMAWVLALEIAAFTAWLFTHPEQTTNASLWTIFAALTATPAGLLGKYFGELRKEQANRLGVQGASLIGAVKSIFK